MANITKIEVSCPICGKLFMARPIDVKVAKERGYDRTCGIVCGGKRRQNNKSQEQKIAEKSVYDREYRKKNREDLKAKKQAYYKTPAGRSVQKRNRDKMVDSHREYIKTPEYKEWKRRYDEKHNAKKAFGEYAEAALILEKILDIIPNREVKNKNGLINKSQKRKRSWLRNRKATLPQ